MDESIEEQPSTSRASSSSLRKESAEDKTDDEMARLLQATDEILENKAKSMNLSSLNVRSILHHLIKYPSTIDVLLGIRETDDLPSVRNMRSRKKPEDSGPSSAVNTPKKIAIRIEDRGPKNFLDLEYEEDDEYDDDYVEEGNSQKEAGAEESEDEEEIYDEEDDDEYDADEDVDDGKDSAQEDDAGKAETSGNSHVDELHNLLLEENDDQEEYSWNITLNDTRPGSAAMVHTLDNVVDDDDYRNFKKSIQNAREDDEFQGVYDTEDDPEDEDYNVISDNLNVEDWDETRQDKTTLIPRHEVKALMMDTLLAEKDIPINIFPDQAIHKDEQKKSQKDKDAEVCERINETVTSSTESCTLLKAGVTFRPQEIDQLKMQLEQHVQLLTQFVVTCHHEEELSHVRNSAQLMMNEMDDQRQKLLYQTIFDVSNLDAAIESCHDINLFPTVDPLSLQQIINSDGTSERVLRPEAVVVLSRSKAIRFPALLPRCQPAFVPQRLTQFLTQEDIMLAFALLQFAHLPRRAEKNLIDRYTVIHENCLPARSPYQIRTHLKTMRRASKNPIHEIIQAAERGVCNITVPETKWHRTDSAIETWPLVSQPKWYRDFQKVFNVTGDRQIHRKVEATMVLTPKKTSALGTTNLESSGIDNEEFFDIGRGPDGRTIIVDRAHINELMNQLIEQSKISPSKRRKNSTPMKLSQMRQLEEDSEKQLLKNEQRIEPSFSSSAMPSTSVKKVSKAARRLSCSRQFAPPSQMTEYSELTGISKNKHIDKFHCEPSTSSAYNSCTPNALMVQDKPFSRNKSSSPKNMDFYGESLIQTDMDYQPPNIEDENLFNIDGDSMSSFPIPLTPGRRSPDEHDHDFLDLETNSLMWTRHSFSVNQANPRTPRDFSVEPEELEPTDFSSIFSVKHSEEDNILPLSSGQRPMGYLSHVEESSNSTSFLEAPSSASSNNRNIPEIEDETSMPGLDLVPSDCEEYIEEGVVEELEEEVPIKKARKNNSRPPLKFKKQMRAGNTNLKASRKRTRDEREAMGSVGLDDEELHEKQKEKVMMKVIEDIRQKLFMHKDTYQRFKKAITSSKLSDIEKVSRVILVLANHPELLNLVLLYAPPEAVISDFESNTNYQSYKAAIEMIMDIDRYITAANLKEPTLRGLFRYIQSFIEDEPNITDEEATRRFYQLFGQDRPLWKKLESQFWCLPFRPKPRFENFEYIDLTGMESMTKKEKKDWNSIPSRFETVDDIDQAMGSVYRPPKNDPPSNLVVKCGELCIRNDDETFIQLDITERHWTRKDDITLFTGYNNAVKTTPHFKYSMIPAFVPELPFGEKSIIARLRYLLAELKAFEDGK